MTLTFEDDLYNVKVNQHSKYFEVKIYHPDTQTHTHTRPINIPGPLKWSVESSEGTSLRLLASQCIKKVSCPASGFSHW